MAVLMTSFPIRSVEMSLVGSRKSACAASKLFRAEFRKRRTRNKPRLKSADSEPEKKAERPTRTTSRSIFPAIDSSIYAFACLCLVLARVDVVRLLVEPFELELLARAEDFEISAYFNTSSIVLTGIIFIPSIYAGGISARSFLLCSGIKTVVIFARLQ